MNSLLAGFAVVEPVGAGAPGTLLVDGALQALSTNCRAYAASDADVRHQQRFRPSAVLRVHTQGR